MSGLVRIPPKDRISKTFGLKASKYEKYAEVQQKFQQILISKIIQEKSDGIWADLGCGTGTLFRTLIEKEWSAQFVGVDLSFPSICYLKERLGNKGNVILADIDHLPFRSATLKGVVFSSVLQWINNFSIFLYNIFRTLQNDGKIFFSIFTDNSFIELSETRKSLCLSNPITLPTPNYISDSLKQCGFIEISLTVHEEIVYFTSGSDLLKSLSAIGSTAVSEKPMTRAQLHTFCSLLESRFKTEKGVPLTYRAVIGWAKKSNL